MTMTKKDTLLVKQQARIQARVDGRIAAHEIVTLLKWPDGHGADYADAFVSQIRDLLPKRKADAIDVIPVPIARLGAVKLEFGAHKGKTLDEVPLKYLDWLCRTTEDTLKDVRAYLKHPDLESRRGRE